MKRGIIWIFASFLIVASVILASCSSSTTTTSTTTQPLTTTTTTTTTVISTTSTAINTTSTTAAVTATTSNTGNWWDSAGTPQYGGTLSVATTTDPAFWDPNQGTLSYSLEFLYLDSMFGTNWATDPAVQNFQLSYWDESYETGDLLTGWEFTAPGVLVLHVRQGIYWQNITPANGRQFNASDIVFHFNRMCGLGSGYSAPADPVYYSNIKSSSTLSIIDLNPLAPVFLLYATLAISFKASSSKFSLISFNSNNF